MAESKGAEAELAESACIGFLDDMLSQREITKAEYDFLRTKYAKSFTLLYDAKKKEQALLKSLSQNNGELINENIMLEKGKIEENHEIAQLRRLDDNKLSMQKDLEFTEQREILAKFELNELLHLHSDLKNDLDQMRIDNTNLVTPVLEGIKKEIADFAVQYKQADDALQKDTEQKELLLAKVEDLESKYAEKNAMLQQKLEQLTFLEGEPGRMKKQLETMGRALDGMNNELKGSNKRLKSIEEDIATQQSRLKNIDQIKKSLLTKIDMNRHTIDQRSAEVSIVKLNYESAKSHNHDLITQRVEYNLSKKDAEQNLRHKMDQYNFAKKDYDNMKRQLKKNRTLLDLVKEVLPTLEDQVKDQDMLLLSYKSERDRDLKAMEALKQEVDMNLAQFLQQEGIEKSKKDELEAAIIALDQMEADVSYWVAEGKRQGKLLSLLSAQRDIKGRDASRMSEKEKESKQHVKIKEIVILDLTKRCNEVSNLLKEFTALYEVVKNERNKYVNLIQSSAQALAEMREKIRILNNEVEILGNESSAKDLALTKERAAHIQAQHQRDTLRQDMNRLLSDYRVKQGVVEVQIHEIDKANIVITTLERDMLDIKSKYEKAVEERNVTGVQLIDRNDELCILYERCNQQQEAMKKGELELGKKEAELRLLGLKTAELERKYMNAKHRLPEMSKYREKIAILESELQEHKKLTDEYSSKLEDPQNVDRWRPLDGDDPDSEMLSAKTQVLEDRLDKKREQLVEKELILEEITALTEKIRSQAIAKRDSAKELADNMNALQSRIRDITKAMLSTVSELTMYQATALRLQQEKAHREKMLEEASWKLDHGEAPHEEAIKDWDRKERKRLQNIEATMKREDNLRLTQTDGAGLPKTTAEPRPTAYIPDEIGIPKPYGSLAPFKPSEPGATMKQFIRNPDIKPIEI